ncbi:MAG TPA: hypothetical protein VJI13_01605 [Candidatus Norongarragalinales archaeon]|nr:hypothetical protein [Candidatus Norongarragalinales archaeon]
MPFFGPDANVEVPLFLFRNERGLPYRHPKAACTPRFSLSETSTLCLPCKTS